MLAPRAVVLATRSAGKARELRALCDAVGITVRDLTEVGLAEEDPLEEGLEVHETFEANAKAKAEWFAARLPGVAVIADDSGLAVDALHGAPGVRSKRWSGSSAHGAALDAANNAALLRALAGTRDRRAAYVCVVVCVAPGAAGEGVWVARGECRGRLLESPRGTAGFGYDPLFLSDELGATFAEVSAAEKASVSHRGRAFRGLLAQWGSPR